MSSGPFRTKILIQRYVGWQADRRSDVGVLLSDTIYLPAPLPKQRHAPRRSPRLQGIAPENVGLDFEREHRLCLSMIPSPALHGRLNWTFVWMAFFSESATNPDGRLVPISVARPDVYDHFPSIYFPTAF